MAPVAGAALIVEVLDTELGVRQKYTFERTPVRIGRSPLNDLPLDRPFVSHCHGVFHFDGASCNFVDLGSTNGTFLASRQLPKNQPVAITQATPLVIGALELHVAHGTSSKVDTRASYAFRPSEIHDAWKPSAIPDVATAPVAAQPPMQELSRLVKQYRKSWDAVIGALIQQSSSGAARQALAEELLAQCPELTQEVEFRRWLGTDRAAPQRSPEPTSRPPAAPAAGRASIVLERFAQTFLELRRGQRHFAAQVGVTSAANESLGGIDDANELLRFLLEPSSSSEDRVDELSRAFADLMLHQVALLNAFQAGARELIAFLSPESLAKHVRGGPAAWFRRLLGRDPRLTSLQQRVDDLAEDTALANLLMGRTFARAYASAMGQDPATTDPAARSQTGRL
jgi:type VI secretion system protein ImpI